LEIARSSKRGHKITNRHGVISQKALIFTNNTVRTSNYGTVTCSPALNSECGEDEAGRTWSEVDTQITILNMKMLSQRSLKHSPAEVSVRVSAFDTLSKEEVT
jgi:hypothetical protein